MGPGQVYEERIVEVPEIEVKALGIVRAPVLPSDRCTHTFHRVTAEAGTRATSGQKFHQCLLTCPGIPLFLFEWP